VCFSSLPGENFKYKNQNENGVIFIMMKKDRLKMENKSNSPIDNPFISNTNRCQLIQKDEYLSPRAACCIRIKNQEEKKNT
jgi:hypothetical protein